MIKLVNKSGKKIDISKETSIEPNKSLVGNIEITPRIQQLINMGLLIMTSVNDNSDNNKPTNKQSFLTSGALRRKQVMDNIKAGYTKPGIRLDNIVTTNKNIKTTKNNRNKRKSK